MTKLFDIAKQITAIRCREVGIHIPDDVIESAGRVPFKEVCGGCSGTGCSVCGNTGEVWPEDELFEDTQIDNLIDEKRMEDRNFL